MPDAIADLVRDALLHLHDPAQRQAHPLLSLVGGTTSSTTLGCGRTLRQALLDGNEALQPGGVSYHPPDQAGGHWSVMGAASVDEAYALACRHRLTKCCYGWTSSDKFPTLVA